MSERTCPSCGAPISATATSCKYCGEEFPALKNEAPTAVQSEPQYIVVNNNNAVNGFESGVNPSWPIKSKTTAGILAILLGGIGAHKFYLGQTGMGILYLLLSWTFIPAIVGFVEGIIYLTTNDHNFQTKYHVRLQ